ncbi:MAG: hypothetical protein ACI89J_004126 [Hyphomicrobiaceae bacterium]
MTQSLIDISPDASHPEGGHAIVLVRSVTEMPEPLRFTISAIPDDPDDVESDAEWSLGEREPLSARITPDGLEMLIGPDIVDASDLQPGTPVLFVLTSGALASGHVSAELSWPDLPVSIQGSLPAPLMDASDLRAEKIESARREKEALAAAAAAERDAKAREADERAAIEREAALASRAAQPKADVEHKPVGSLADVLAAATVAATADSETPLNRASRSDHSAAGRTAPTTMASEIASAQRVAASQSVTSPTVTSQSATNQSNDKITDRVTLPTMPAAASATREIAVPEVAVPQAHEIAAVDAPRRSRARSGSWLSIALAVIALPALLFAFWPSLSDRADNPSFIKTTLAQLPASDWVTAILEVGDRSPNGTDATRIAPHEALKRAEAAIFDPDKKANLEERKFWLRKSIALLLAEPQSRWAVTQLGALHTASADPKKQPEYRSAKTLWELASISGDTVAACFVGQLYEFGLGVVVSKERAAQWYQRANKRGGCNVRHERSTASLTN